jgi:hypothetical protein
LRHAIHAVLTHLLFAAALVSLSRVLDLALALLEVPAEEAVGKRGEESDLVMVVVVVVVVPDRVLSLFRFDSIC